MTDITRSVRPTAPAEASAPATFKQLSAACPLLPVSDFDQARDLLGAV